MGKGAFMEQQGGTLEAQNLCGLHKGHGKDFRAILIFILLYFILGDWFGIQLAPPN